MNLALDRDHIAAVLRREIAKYADEMPMQFMSEYLADELMAELKAVDLGQLWVDIDNQAVTVRDALTVVRRSMGAEQGSGGEPITN